MTDTHRLTIYRGSVFHAVAWPLSDDDGEPAPIGGTARCVARPWRSSDQAVELPASVVGIAVGSADPVAHVQIDAMDAAATLAFPITTGVWELTVDDELIISGSLVASWSVVRS